MVTKTKLTVQGVLQELRSLYKPPRTFLHYRTPLDLLVVTILSAQCTDARVNTVSKMLYKKYNTAKNYVTVPREELENDIRSCGTFRMKAKHIQEMCAILLEKHKGNVPHTMEELLELPGVGRKTASIILWACFSKNEGIAVDTHVFRVARRLGLSSGRTPAKVELDLMESTPKRSWGTLTTLLISHGRAVCTARNRKCDQCIFQKMCPSSHTERRRDLGKL